MLFEVEGGPARVIRAGEAFWEPGGDLIHYQDSNQAPPLPGHFGLPARRALAGTRRRTGIGGVEGPARAVCLLTDPAERRCPAACAAVVSG